jgi:hypothetical protein
MIDTLCKVVEDAVERRDDTDAKHNKLRENLNTVLANRKKRLAGSGKGMYFSYAIVSNFVTFLLLPAVEKTTREAIKDQKASLELCQQAVRDAEEELQRQLTKPQVTESSGPSDDTAHHSPCNEDEPESRDLSDESTLSRAKAHSEYIPPPVALAPVTTANAGVTEGAREQTEDTIPPVMLASTAPMDVDKTERGHAGDLLGSMSPGIRLTDSPEPDLQGAPTPLTPLIWSAPAVTANVDKQSYDELNSSQLDLQAAPHLAPVATTDTNDLKELGSEDGTLGGNPILSTSLDNCATSPAQESGGNSRPSSPPEASNRKRVAENTIDLRNRKRRPSLFHTTRRRLLKKSNKQQLQRGPWNPEFVAWKKHPDRAQHSQGEEEGRESGSHIDSADEGSRTGHVYPTVDNVDNIDMADGTKYMVDYNEDQEMKVIDDVDRNDLIRTLVIQSLETDIFSLSAPSLHSHTPSVPQQNDEDEGSPPCKKPKQYHTKQYMVTHSDKEKVSNRMGDDKAHTKSTCM